MLHASLNLVFAVAFFSLIATPNAIKFQIFKDFDYKGLYYELNEDSVTTSKCVDLVKYARGTVGSVRTDTCIIAYEGLGCSGFSTKLQPNTSSQAKYMKPLYSYHLCNSTHGGDKIHVNLYGNANDDSLLAEYPDICGCQDIPAQIAVNTRRLKNYMNCVKVYETETCSGRSREFPGGSSPESENLATLDSYVRSISACGDKPACVRLEAITYKFELVFDDARSAEPADPKNVELAAKTTFYNNGSATVTQEYMASKTMRQSFTIEKSSSSKQMHRGSIEGGISGSFSGNGNATSKNANGTASLQAEGSLSGGYTYENTKESGESESYTNEEERTFTVTQTIEIPPCSQYEVSSTVSVVENLPIVYDVFTKVRGNSSGLRMTAEQIIQHVSEMTFVEQYDEHTVIYKTRDILFANVGIDTWITGEGTEIENCLNRESSYINQVQPNIVKHLVREYN